ncbi:O-succinylbenzoic acid--CoA ligase [Formosa sp. Hel1_31_208]|uniref:AMP-binding protein n=1 Tax=Formosa sp. Hel1_31_208 TaxID=1798225 RepID=UPI00087C0B5E|nr:AMP-binding protein [Formosa sp. Hel1_31_208]SDS47821.1 O-succinylbenzoic acid--CoA ligase [Formosa sp. Hel1_31_208]
MTPTFDKIHLRFKLNGFHFDHDELKEVAYNLVKEGEVYEKTVGDFLLDWLDDKDDVLTKTSGSTGLPKLIKIKKQEMVNSSVMTGDYFGLEPGNKALHCLPSQFIAGKMMLVRAMILGLELDIVAPSSIPSYDDQKAYDFCAMIPLQLQNSIQRLDHIKVLIVGGARVSNDLRIKLQKVKASVFETYGMTETVSHIAVRQLNHASENQTHFKILRDIFISKDDRDCLVIDAKELSKDVVLTNDVVDMISDTEFDIIGRYDNMINSGGVKLFPELIEAKLQDKIDKRFFITSEKDKDLGEKVIMVIEAESNQLDAEVYSGLEKFEIPKTVYHIPKFLETPNAKIQRQKTLDVILGKVTH